MSRIGTFGAPVLPVSHLEHTIQIQTEIRLSSRLLAFQIQTDADRQPHYRTHMHFIYGMFKTVM